MTGISMPPRTKYCIVGDNASLYLSRFSLVIFVPVGGISAIAARGRPMMAAATRLVTARFIASFLLCLLGVGESAFTEITAGQLPYRRTSPVDGRTTRPFDEIRCS